MWKRKLPNKLQQERKKLREQKRQIEEEFKKTLTVVMKLKMEVEETEQEV